MQRVVIGMCCLAALALAGGLTAAPAQALVPDGGQGWYWQMPQPAGSIADVAFATPTDVWAVGPGGTILHSADAGQTWTPQPSGSTADLSSVSFLNGLRGWACGTSASGGGVLLTTSNGGATWTDATPAGLGAALASVDFTDAMHGFMGTADGHCLATTNGGVTWISHAVGPLTGAVSVDFADARHGWATDENGRMARTANGGVSWKAMSLVRGGRTWVADAALIDATHGWVVVEHSTRSDDTVLVLRTSNGGATWRAGRPLAWRWPVGLYASSAESAWVLTTGGFNSAAELQHTVTIVRHTTDGGAHWTSTSLGSSFLTTAAAGDADSLCVVGQGILTSADAGATWTSKSSGQQYSIGGADAVSAADIWAVDFSGAIIHSVDGARWAEAAAPIRWSSNLRDVCFPDAQHGWAVGVSDFFSPLQRGVILHTSDGGASWLYQTSNLAGSLAGVDFVDSQKGWAISDYSWGSNGANTGLEYTTDGGATWIPQWVVGSSRVTAVDFIDATTGWVAGDYRQPSGNPAAIYRTTNAGLTWTRQTTMPSGAPNMTSLQFLDALNGWAAGVSYDEPNWVPHGWVLHTTDGGVTWTRLQGLDSAQASAVHFSDALHGWLAGNGVFATIDGGATWQKVAGGSFGTLVATDATHVWAFGSAVASTVDAAGDTAPPATLDDADAVWHGGPVTVTLKAYDIGGSGLASTQFSTDGGTTWQAGTSISIAAPADHANDGVHTVLYRSSDNAGNREATESFQVPIDTLGPKCAAPWKAIINTGQRGIIRFKAIDSTSGIGRATITIRDRRGRAVRTFVEQPGNWGSDPAPTYFWLRFKCALSPGAYRIEVRATDLAGNRQVSVGRNSLRVVVSGAPVVRPPYWGQGLPYAAQAGSSLARLSSLRGGGQAAWPGSALAARLFAERRAQ
jgi:photosystem II stability/assembly factor-like uncharacterized protein